MDFPETRAAIDALTGLVDMIARSIPAPIRVPIPGRGFRWDYAAQDAEAVLITKAVRIASGLRAAMVLADACHTVECGVVLRTVADFASEIVFVAEGLLESRFTDDQERFIRLHFSPMPSSPDELAAREREYYVSRKDIAKVHSRIANKTGAPSDFIAKIAAYLNKGYDSYVHGSSAGTMELFSGFTMSYMMRGSESARLVCVAKVSVAGKLKEAINALRFMAIARRMPELAAQLDSVFDRVDKSAEDTRAPCIGLENT